MSSTNRGGGTQNVQSSGDPWVNATNYQRQQLLGVATGDVSGQAGGGYEPGYARYLTGPTAAGPTSPYTKTVESSLRNLLAPNPLEVPGAEERGYLKRISDFATAPVIDPLEQKALTRYEGTANPDANLSAAQQYLQRISGPALQSAATASGQGRSGAVNEALAQEGTRMALPILQDSLNAQRGLASAEANIGGQVRDRTLSNLQTALAAAEAPRLAELQSTTKPEQVLLNAYGLPPSPSGAGTQTARISQWNRPSEFSQVIQGLQGVASIAGAFLGGGGGGGCWVAAEVWGPYDIRFWRAWSYVNFDPSPRARVVRAVYRAVGRPLARWARHSSRVKRVCEYLLKKVIPGV